MKKYLVVGGGGFIGQALVQHLQARGDQVALISHRDSLSTIPVDLLDPISCQQLKDHHFNHVFNCAGYVDHCSYFDGGQAVFDQHFTLVRNLVDHLNWDAIESFVQVGSSDEYGDHPAPQHEGMRERSISPYSCGKSLATHFLQMLARTEGLPIQIARLFLVYGPGQKSNRFLPQIIQSCLRNESFDVSEGKQQRDFLYIDDVVEGLLKCSKYRNSFGEIFNLASGQPFQLSDVVAMVQQLVGMGRPNIGASSYREGENMALYADINKAKTLLAWQPRISLAQGLKQSIVWYQTQMQQQEVI